MQKAYSSSMSILLCLLLGLVAATAMAADGALSDYRLHEGDVLEIAVWKEEGLAREIVIAPDGNITFPLVGQIRAKNLSVAELQKALVQKFASYIPEPSVSVVLKASSGSKFFVIGKVNRPGQYPLDAPLTILQALSVAGGTTTFADSGNIKVIRRAGAQQQVLNFDYGDVEKGDSLEQNRLLESGDVVLVP